MNIHGKRERVSESFLFAKKHGLLKVNKNTG